VAGNIMTKTELIRVMNTGVEAVEIFRGAVTPELIDKIEERIQKTQSDINLKMAIGSLFGLRPDEISSTFTSILQVVALIRTVLASGDDLKVKETLQNLLNSPVKLTLIAGVL
jgi:hypothetical protein